MQLELTDGEILLQDTFARLFQDEATPARVRAAEAEGIDAALWRHLVELGAPMLRTSEAAGGGGSLRDAAIVAYEAGRFLAPVPLVEAMVATRLLHALGAPAAVLDRLTAGEIATLALGQGTQIVPAGGIASFIVARDGDRVVLLTDPQVGERPANIGASPIARIDPGQIEATRTTLGEGAEASAAFGRAIEEWKLLTAASLAGVGGMALELAAAYSKERLQFGQPIGSFQGVAHPLANSATDVDGGRLLVDRAIWAIATGRKDAAAAVDMAYWFCGRAASVATARAVRTFGGYGVSLEYDVQLYFRRARLSTGMMEAPDRALDRIAGRLWLGETATLPDAGAVELDFSFGASAEAYAEELKAFVLANMTPDVEAKKHHSTSGHHPGFAKKLAAAGYLMPDFESPGRPKRTREEVLASSTMWEEMDWTRTPTAITEFVAQMVQHWGTGEAQAEILPRMIEGESTACLGFSEPGSGSDVFAAKLKATRDGDDWIVSGSKMFTTNAHNADYILLLARSDSSGKKHQGLTMFVCPLNLPGVEIQPVYTLQDERTNIVYFQDVRIGGHYLLGEAGQGAKVMSFALGLEHGGFTLVGAYKGMMRHAVSWACAPVGNGAAPIEREDVRRALARAAVNYETSFALSVRQAWADLNGKHRQEYGPMSKLFTTESMFADGEAITLAAGPEALLWNKSDLGYVELSARRGLAMTIYGGTSEIHRSIIAENALGMPRTRA